MGAALALFERSPFDFERWVVSRNAQPNENRHPPRSPIRTALGLTVAELAIRAALTDDDIERIEEGGTEPTIPLLRRLAAALNADAAVVAWLRGG